ncbi:hypothetical protein OE903_03525 [Bacillus sp. B6(2022)]|nr:hypothetical protein [Bacillus sp. B6(2022)]
MPINDEKKLREQLMEAGLQETRARMLSHYYTMYQTEQPRLLMKKLKEKLQDRQTEKLKKCGSLKSISLAIAALGNLCYHTLMSSLI